MKAAARHVMPVRFQGPEGELEGLWDDRGEAGPGRAPAVICHPHPAHGGSMHSKVVHTVYRVLHGRGHPTLRFNFRGVGTSEGRYSGGEGEVLDVAAAAAYACGKTGSAKVWLCGFSFGSWAGSRWAAGGGVVERLVLLGLPVTVNIDGRTFEHLTHLPAPALLVQGERDRYGSPADVHALRDRLARTGRVEARIVSDADHFFTGKLTELKAALEDGLTALDRG